MVPPFYLFLPIIFHADDQENDSLPSRPLLSLSWNEYQRPLNLLFPIDEEQKASIYQNLISFKREKRKGRGASKRGREGGFESVVSPLSRTQSEKNHRISPWVVFCRNKICIIIPSRSDTIFDPHLRQKSCQARMHKW